MRNGLAEEDEAAGEAPEAPAQLLPSPEVGSQRTLAREDFAELVLQYALRCARFKEEGAPALRVVRVAPAPEGMVERPVVNYESVIGGPKTRAALGTAQSADWGELLAPFGVVRQSDPNDWRVLVEINPYVEEVVYQSPKKKTKAGKIISDFVAE